MYSFFVSFLAKRLHVTLNCNSLYIKIVLADYNLMGVFWFCVVASHIKRIFFCCCFFLFLKNGAAGAQQAELCVH